MTFGEIALSIVCSVIASFVFWVLTFRISRTKVEFSDCVEKTPAVLKDGVDPFRYRVALINTKNTDLIEVSFIVRLSVRREKINNNTFLQLGYPTSIPVLHGKRWQMKHLNRNASWKIPIKMTESALEEFSKDFYPPLLRDKAKAHTLTLHDIFDKLDDRVRITIYAFGYDAVTGARRLFISKGYMKSDIIEGHFKANCRFKRYNDFVSHILGIEKAEQNFERDNIKEENSIEA